MLRSLQLVIHKASHRPEPTLGLMPCYTAHGGDDSRWICCCPENSNTMRCKSHGYGAFCCPLINHAICIAWRVALCAKENGAPSRLHPLYSHEVSMKLNLAGLRVGKIVDQRRGDRPQAHGDDLFTGRVR